MKVLYIGYNFKENKNGGNIVRENHYKVLKQLYGENLYEVFIEKSERKVDIIRNYCMFSFNGQSKEKDKQVLEIIEKKK